MWNVKGLNYAHPKRSEGGNGEKLQRIEMENAQRKWSDKIIKSDSRRERAGNEICDN